MGRDAENPPNAMMRPCRGEGGAEFREESMLQRSRRARQRAATRADIAMRLAAMACRIEQREGETK